MHIVPIVDILLIHNGRVLLVQQRKPSAYGMWGFPGGHVEDGESHRQAIIREIREELGIALSEGAVADSLTHTEQQTSEGYLEVTTFVASLPDAPLTIQHEELLGFGLFTLEEVERLAPSLRSSWILPLAKKFLA